MWDDDLFVIGPRGHEGKVVTLIPEEGPPKARCGEVIRLQGRRTVYRADKIFKRGVHID